MKLFNTKYDVSTGDQITLNITQENSVVIFNDFSGLSVAVQYEYTSLGPFNDKSNIGGVDFGLSKGFVYATAEKSATIGFSYVVFEKQCERRIVSNEASGNIDLVYSPLYAKTCAFISSYGTTSYVIINKDVISAYNATGKKQELSSVMQREYIDPITFSIDIQTNKTSKVSYHSNEQTATHFFTKTITGNMTSLIFVDPEDPLESFFEFVLVILFILGVFYLAKYLRKVFCSKRDLNLNPGDPFPEPSLGIPLNGAPNMDKLPKIIDHEAHFTPDSPEDFDNNVSIKP